MSFSSFYRCCFLFLGIMGGDLFASNPISLPDQFHTDGRTTAKLQFFPKSINKGKEKKTGLELVESFLKEAGFKYGVSKNLSNLKLTRVKKSLVGYHFRYQQLLEGTPVDRGEIIINLNHSQDSITSLYNNLFPGKPNIRLKKRLITEEEAYDQAWNAIRVHGQLIESPRIKLKFYKEGQGLSRFYEVNLSVSKPYGAWKIIIDACVSCYQLINSRTGDIEQIKLSVVRLCKSACAESFALRQQAWS